ncbi:fungal-specific transcription factor domain-containing protein [Infundibulicybe gibba]|nr:fungal-specific transcription factor domain-containing protein [Infundibulicybe gibba]
MDSPGEGSTSPSPAPDIHPSAIASAHTTNAALSDQPKPKPKRKRNRAILSCQPCHDRKQQCDRSQPCKRCVARGAQELCRYDRSIVQMARNSESERFQTFQRFSQLDRVVPTSTGGLEPTALLGLETLIQLVQATTGGLAVRNISNSAIPDQHTTPVDHAVQAAAAALGQLSQQAPNHPNLGYGQMADFMSHTHDGHGHTPSALSALAELRTHFPNHAITGHLLYFFFNHSSMPWLWVVVHKPTFDTCFLAFSSGHHPPSLDFIALLAMMCTTSLQFLPESPADASIFADYEAGRVVLKQRLYDFSRSVLHDDVLFPTLERVEALLLLAVYQLNEGNIAAYYNTTGITIRMAQSLNMHQEPDPQKFGIIQAETRRRIWWSLFILDCLQCLMLLRPHAIHEQHCNVTLPSNLSQIDIQEGPMCTYPSTHVTEQTFHILQIHWAKLMRRMWERCFASQIPSYKSILDFEEEIRKFERDLPTSFRSQTTQTAVNMPYLLFQNRITTLQIYHARAILLRPILLIKNSPTGETGLSNFHQSARSVCIAFSKRLLAWQLVVQNQADRSQLRWSDFVIRIFDAAVIFSVAIITDPQDSQNDELFEWILIAHYLLKDLTICSPLATSAIRILENIQRHPQITNISASNVTPTAIIPDRYLERATFTLAQSQPSIVDLLGDQAYVDPLWDNEQLAVFTRRYPSAEVLCSGADPQAVLLFLDGCGS